MRTLERARAEQEEANRRWREKVGPYWDARSGACCKCGNSLGAYWTKLINIKDGRIQCPGA